MVIAVARLDHPKEKRSRADGRKGTRRSDRSHGPHSGSDGSAEGGKVDDRDAVQPQDQAVAPGSQSHRLPAAVQREAGTAE